MLMDFRNAVKISFCGEEMWLDGRRAVYWPNENALLCSDLHVGRAGHYRKNGIPMGLELADEDLECLSELIHDYEVDKVYFLGDLFHSEFNFEFDDFASFINSYPEVKFILIPGNHDRFFLKDIQLEGLWVEKKVITKSGIDLIHEREDANQCSISGHIHPAVRLNGRGRDAITLPCFEICNNHMLLPAFSRQTGGYVLKPNREKKYYPILKEKIAVAG